MQIILITSKLNLETAGGSVVDLHFKAKGLVELGHQVTVVTAFSKANKISGHLPYAVKEENVSTAYFVSLQYKIFKLLRKYEQDADVFYVDGNSFLYGGGMFRWLGGRIPVVAFFNVKLSCYANQMGGGHENKNIFIRTKRRLRILLEKYIGTFISNKLDAFIFTTPMVRQFYLDFKFKKSKSHVIPDFVNTQEIINKQYYKDVNLHHQSAETVNILCSGRMITEKGFDLVIKAFSIMEHKERFKVIMSGSGPDKERLQEMVNNLGLRSYISFPGWVTKEELEKFFQQAHIFILPKWWIEYTSVLLIEAMAYGLPSIVSGGGGLEWLVGKKGLTFKEDDIISLARKIEELGNNSELRIDLAESILKKAVELDYKKLIIQMEDVMRSVVV